MNDVGDDRHVAEAHSKIPDGAKYRAPIRAILRRNKGTLRARIDIMDSGRERAQVWRSFGQGAKTMPQFVIEREMPGAGKLRQDDFKGAAQGSCSAIGRAHV